eukprot:Rmarinus@m.2530
MSNLEGGGEGISGADSMAEPLTNAGGGATGVGDSDNPSNSETRSRRGSAQTEHSLDIGTASNEGVDDRSRRTDISDSGDRNVSSARRENSNVASAASGDADVTITGTDHPSTDAIIDQREADGAAMSNGRAQEGVAVDTDTDAHVHANSAADDGVAVGAIASTGADADAAADADVNATEADATVATDADADADDGADGAGADAEADVDSGIDNDVHVRAAGPGDSSTGSDVDVGTPGTDVYVGAAGPGTGDVDAISHGPDLAKACGSDNSGDGSHGHIDVDGHVASRHGGIDADQGVGSEDTNSNSEGANTSNIPDSSEKHDENVHAPSSPHGMQSPERVDSLRREGRGQFGGQEGVPHSVVSVDAAGKDGEAGATESSLSETEKVAAFDFSSEEVGARTQAPGRPSEGPLVKPNDHLSQSDLAVLAISGSGTTPSGNHKSAPRPLGTEAVPPTPSQPPVHVGGEEHDTVHDEKQSGDVDVTPHPFEPDYVTPRGARAGASAAPDEEKPEDRLVGVFADSAEALHGSSSRGVPGGGEMLQTPKRSSSLSVMLDGGRLGVRVSTTTPKKRSAKASVAEATPPPPPMVR